MCQLRVDGGRRCPVHLESTRAIIAITRESIDLSIRQMQLVFAEARGRRPMEWTYPTPEDRERDFALLGMLVPALSELSANDKDQIDDRTLKAYLSVEAVASRHEVAQSRAIQAIAELHGGSEAQAQQRFTLLLHRFERSPAERDAMRVSVEEAVTYIHGGILPHPATLAAYKATVQSLGAVVLPITEANRVSLAEETGGRYSSIAWDEESGQIELMIAGVEQPTYYRNTPREVYARIVDPETSNPAQYIEDHLLHNAHAQYNNQGDAGLDRLVARCARCGQFANIDNDHYCPPRAITEEAITQGIDYEKFSEQEMSILYSQVRMGIPADDIMSAFLPSEGAGENETELLDDEDLTEGIIGEQIATSFRSVSTQNIPEQFSELVEGLASLDPTQLHRANSGIAHTEFRDRVMTIPNSLNGLTIKEIDLPRWLHITGVNSTARSKFGSYLDGSADEIREFANQEDALSAFSDPANANRIFIHTVQDDGTRHFLGTLPRGVVLRKRLDKLLVRQRFNETTPDGLISGEEDQQEFLSTPMGQRYSMAKNSVDWEKAENGDHQLRPVINPLTMERVNEHIKNFDNRMITKNFDNAVSNVREGHDGYFTGLLYVQKPRANVRRGIPLDRHSLVDNEGRLISLHTDDGAGNVTFEALVYKDNQKGLIVDTGRTLKCDCDEYAEKYYCVHTRYVHATLQTTVTDHAMDMAGYSSYTRGNFDDFKELHPGVPLSAFSAQFMTHIDNGKVLMTREDGNLTLSTDDDTLRGPNRHPVRQDVMSVVNDESLTNDEKILILGQYQTNAVHDVIGIEEIRRVLRAPNTRFILTTQVLGQEVKLVITHEQEELLIDGRSIVRCPACGRFVGRDGCSHESMIAESLATMKRVINREYMNTPEEDESYTQHLAQELSTLRKAQYREQYIQRAMETQGMSREEAAEYIDSIPVVTQEDLVARAQEIIDERALNQPTLAEYRERLNNDTINMTTPLEELVGTERAQKIQESAFHRAEKWLRTDPEIPFDDAKAIVTHAQTESVTSYSAPRMSDVTDGICDISNPSALGFGIEIEFDLEDENVNLEDIQQALYDAGLATNEYVGLYQSGSDSGWEGFNIEYDTTVDGELVTPILYDTPEDWAKLNEALEILKEYGAISTENTGGHVNISTHNLVGNNAKHIELARTMIDHEEALFRIASDPSSGEHRGIEYCNPRVSLPQGDVRIDQKRIINTGRYDRVRNINIEVSDRDAGVSETVGQYATNSNGHKAINLEESLETTPNARAEFRLWDGSIDLATIQTHVAISAAMVDYADRKVEAEGFSKLRHQAEEYFDGDDGAIRSANDLAHKLFRKQEDRERLLTLLGTDGSFRES